MVPAAESIAAPLVICGKAESSTSRNVRQPRPQRHGDRDAHRAPPAQHSTGHADCGRQQVEARRRRAEGATLAELARSYGVGKSTISRL